jgi:RNA-directed DNA polymerase
VKDTAHETETELPTVPGRARQGGEAAAPAESQWGWVERAVWTERMLQALDEGVKGGVWFSLMDKVYAKRHLAAAFEKVKANAGAAGVDRVTVAMFDKDREANLERLHEQLRTGSYRPQAVRRAYIPKPGSRERRPLGIPTVGDRVVQTALRNVLDPIFERDFAEHSYGFRPRRGCKDALRRVMSLLLAGHVWVVDADFKSYFDTIPHEPLLARVREKVADGRVLELVAAYLDQRVLEDGRHWEPETGTPQGAVVSPLLANIYLDPLDHEMAARGWEMVRYADDLVVLCRTEDEAQRALAAVGSWAARAGLCLHPDKTRLVDVEHSEGFDFLGYHFQVSKTNPRRFNRWPRKKSLRKLKDSVRALTRRNSGTSLPTIIERLNPLLRGFFEYFKHSLKNTFDGIDGWVRMRLRSILRTRRKGRGRGRGSDHQRWPNRYFGELGLFSLANARVATLQSARR